MPRQIKPVVAAHCLTGWMAAVAVLTSVLLASSPSMAQQVDFHDAVVVESAHASGPQAQAVRMLVEEVEKRTQLHWKVSDQWPPAAQPVIVVGLASFVEPALREQGLTPPSSHDSSTAPEGFRLQSLSAKAPVLIIAGNDDRGVLFGVGRLLRELRLGKQRAVLAGPISIATSPKYALRGHQLGYRPKTNSYDGWSVPIWEQYVRDLAVFGTNAVELIPPRSDDAADSPHFPLPPMQMMVEMSRLLDQYGLDVWIWYPAMDRDYSDPATVRSALAEWGEVFRRLPRIDAVFVPGGDPGHTEPTVLMSLLEQQTANLHRFHPKAQMWVSPQSFNQKWLDAFVAYLKMRKPGWLAGVVYGPQVRIPLPELRALVPAKYPIRRYPDITHSRQCQYPVIDWDVAYAITEGREVINPRPQDEAHIFRALQKEGIGFITYSEGCNDDVNKFIWSGLGWDPDQPVIEILREYARYFIGDSIADDFAQGLLALERNWRGPLLTNTGVITALEQFQAMERTASPSLLLNWRFQQALYRAYYDAYIHDRLVSETALERQALSLLDAAPRLGSLRAMNDAESVLDRAVQNPPSAAWRARVFELGEALFQSIRMQLSVARYKAIAVDRGATLDTIDVPLNNRLWLERLFGEIRKLDGENDRLRELQAIVHWTDPGPGGFYDDLGNVQRQPHLVRGAGFDADPGLYETPRFGYINGRGIQARYPMSWWDNVEALYDAPLKMHYDDLDPHAAYSVRLSYAGDSPGTRIRLVANDKFVVHPEISKPRPAKLLEFDIPQAATASGQLTLTWYRERGLGGNGRGCAIAEVWLIKKPH